MFAFLLNGHCGLASGWERLPSLPEPNSGFVCGVVDGDIVVAGGANWQDERKHWLDRIWCFRIRENRWIEAGRLPAPTAYAATGQIATGVVFLGGSDGAKTHLQLYNLGGDRAARPISPISERAVYSGAAVVGGRMYVLGGGEDAADLQTLTSRFFAVDLSDGRTIPFAPPPGGPRMLPLLVAMGDRLLAFTGAGFDARMQQVINTDAAQAFSLKTGRWTALNPYPLAVRGLAGCVLDDRHVLLAGGYDSRARQFTNAAFVYDAQDDRYAPTTVLPFRALTTLVHAGDLVYCLGGEDKGRHRTDAMFRIAASELTALSRNAPPLSSPPDR